MSVTADGNDDGTKSGSLVTNDGHQRRNNRHHAGDKLWGFHKNSAYGFLNRIIRIFHQYQQSEQVGAVKASSEPTLRPVNYIKATALCT
jgi:hypothetical protein